MLRRHDSGRLRNPYDEDCRCHDFRGRAIAIRIAVGRPDVLLLLGTRQPSYAREVEIRVDELRKRWTGGMRNQSWWTSVPSVCERLNRASVVASLSNHRDDHQRRQRLRALFLQRHGVIIGTQVTGITGEHGVSCSIWTVRFRGGRWFGGSRDNGMQNSAGK